MKKLLYFVIGLLLSGYGSAQDLTKEVDLVGPVGVNVPYGQSSWNTDIQPTRANPLKVVYWRNAQCNISFTLSVNVHYRGQNYWTTTQADNLGYFRHSGNEIDGIKLNFSQNEARTAFCQIKVSGILLDQQPAPQPQPTSEYIGQIYYTGGFVNKAPITFNRSIVLNTFQVKIPDFCKGVEVVEAGTLFNNQYILAAQNSQDHSQYSFTNLLTLDNLAISLNGPLNLTCEVPVYVYPQGYQ